MVLVILVVFVTAFALWGWRRVLWNGAVRMTAELVANYKILDGEVAKARLCAAVGSALLVRDDDVGVQRENSTVTLCLRDDAARGSARRRRRFIREVREHLPVGVGFEVVLLVRHGEPPP